MHGYRGLIRWRTFTYNPAAHHGSYRWNTYAIGNLRPDRSDYATQSTTVQLVVNQGVPVIIWPTPTPISYGTPLNGFQLDATATSGTVSGTASLQRLRYLYPGFHLIDGRLR